MTDLVAALVPEPEVDVARPPQSPARIFWLQLQRTTVLRNGAVQILREE